VSDEISAAIRDGWPMVVAFFCAALITFIASLKVIIVEAPEGRLGIAGKR
jgi:hypothetical protein